MKKQHYIALAVAAVAVWWFFFREKKAKPVDSVVPIPTVGQGTPDRDALPVVGGPVKIPQDTPLNFYRPGTDQRVVSGLNLGNGGSSSRMVFNNRQQARKYYMENGAGGACSFVELTGGQFEVSCP